MQELRSYLGIHEDRELRVLVSPQIPDFSVNLNEGTGTGLRKQSGYTDDGKAETGK